jgi:hypothetical protein
MLSFVYAECHIEGPCFIFSVVILSLAMKPITLNVVVLSVVMLSVVAQGRLADTRDSIQNPRADQRQTDQQGGQKI